jgi:uncharacterized membrane protein YhaH (DUF805 family)
MITMHWLTGPITKYTVWKGRATRSEYWYFILFTTLITIGLTMIDLAAGTFDEETSQGLISGLFSLFIFLPSIAVFVRRLHDTGRSGWWFWILLVPLIGFIVILVFFCTDSQEEANQYGPNPKGLGSPGSESQSA